MSRSLLNFQSGLLALGPKRYSFRSRSSRDCLSKGLSGGGSSPCWRLPTWLGQFQCPFCWSCWSSQERSSISDPIRNDSYHRSGHCGWPWVLLLGWWRPVGWSDWQLAWDTKELLYMIEGYSKVRFHQISCPPSYEQLFSPEGWPGGTRKWHRSYEWLSTDLRLCEFWPCRPQVRCRTGSALLLFPVECAPVHRDYQMQRCILWGNRWVGSNCAEPWLPDYLSWAPWTQWGYRVLVYEVELCCPCNYEK